MATVNTSSNSTLVRDDVRNILIGPITRASTFLGLPDMPRFESEGSVVKVPALSSVGTATYIAQGSAIAEATVTTTEVELLPSTVHAVKRMIRVSNEAIAQSVVNVESSFANALVTELQRVVDQGLWAGVGSAGQPLGLTNFTTINSLGTAGIASGTALPTDLYDMVKAAQEANLNPQTLQWVMSPTMFRKVRVMMDGYSRPLLQPSLAEGAPEVILGHPYVVTTAVATDGIWLFDRSQVAVGIDNTASVFVTPHRYADTAETAIIATFRADCAPMNDQAVVAVTGYTA